jgi:ubiquinone/menaquinone biosynthesis C-methylase UbiE
MRLEVLDHAAEIEAKLRQHPGVRQAAVFLWKPADVDRRLVAYVVPDSDYLDRTLAGADDESRRIERWRKTYELTQLGKESNVSQPDFNILGWNSSYTRLAIPDDQMREWVDLTVQEIQRCEPSEVLELGCGTGLLLLRLARRCKRYVGVDNAHVVLETLKRHMHQLGSKWTQVQLLERAADQFDGFGPNSFDTLIVNSVAQYFPSLNYLLKVLEKAVGVMKTGGRIFLGDLRSLPLQGSFGTSVELFQAAPTMTVAELRERAQKRIRLDEQLVLSPELFLALRQRWPKVSRVELKPRRGRFDNEMNRYRFNAILCVGSAPAKTVEPRWISWPLEKVTLESLAGILEKRDPELLGIAEVGNRRIEKDVLAFAKLQTRNGTETVGSFKKEVQETAYHGIDPQDLWSLGEKFDYDVRISWAASRTDGSYDAVFRRTNPNDSSDRTEVAWPEQTAIHDDLRLYANAPTKAVPREKLLQQLREYCQEHLPETIRPNDIILLNTHIFSPDGKPDRRALPSPDAVDL